MRAVILGDVDKTTTFIDNLLDSLWLDIEDIDADAVLKESSTNTHPDIIFLCDLDPEVAAQIKKSSKAIVYTLKDTRNIVKNGARTFSLHARPELVVQDIQDAIRSRLIKEQTKKVFTHGECVLKDYALKYPGGKLHLSPKEALILGILMEIPGKVIDRETVTSMLGEGVDTEERNVDSMIKRLRRKIAPIAEHIDIETFYGVGYALRISPEQVKDFPSNVAKANILFVPDRGQLIIDDVLINETLFTKKESKIFGYLLEHMDQLTAREPLMDVIYTEHDAEDTPSRNVDSHIKRIRLKLGEWRDLIKTDYGEGYTLDSEFLRKKSKIEKEKNQLYVNTPRELSEKKTWEDIVAAFDNPKLKGNYTYYGQAIVEGKTLGIKIVRISHPEGYTIYEDSMVRHKQATEVNFYDAVKRFAGVVFNKVNKPDFIAFDETDISQHRVHCPQELTGTLPFSQVVEVLSSPVNIGTYLYYGRLKMASEWPRAYVAVERTTDPKEPLVVCIALLENRMKKKIHHLTVKEALEKFGTAKFEKMNSVTGIFQQPSREAEGKVSRQQCPPNLVNGTRSIASIIEVFQNPTYSGEYIYAGSIDMKDFKVGDKYVYDPYVVLQRNGNAVEVRLIGHHFERMISPKLQIDYSKRAPTIIKISLEQLKELGIKNVTKVPFVGPLKEHAKMRADDIAPPVVKTGQEVEFTREMSFTDLAQAMEKGVISPEYKHFYLVGENTQIKITTFKSASGAIQFVIEDGSTGLNTKTLEGLMKYATEKKLKVMRREVYIMESAIISIKAIETLLAKEVYKEVLYAFEEHGKRRMCRVEKKNGRIYVHCDGVVLPIDEFKDKHLKRIMFQELKKK